MALMNNDGISNKLKQSIDFIVKNFDVESMMITWCPNTKRYITNWMCNGKGMSEKMNESTYMDSFIELVKHDNIDFLRLEWEKKRWFRKREYKLYWEKKND